jgi:hypothetical protein
MARRWKPADDTTLRALYAEGASLRTIGERLARSEQAVDERRRVLGVAPRRHVRPWTRTQDALLHAAAAAAISDHAVAEQLGRPVEQVRLRRRQIIGPRSPSRPYSAGEDERLRSRWPDGDITVLADELGRSVGSIRLRAQSLGLHHPRPRRRWAAQEDVVVRDGYEQALSCTQIADVLAGRTPGAVAARAAKLGVATYARAWTQLDDRRLRLLSAEGMAVESIAQALGRTPQALLLRARRTGVSLPASNASRSGRRWTAAEDDVLRLNVALNPAVLAGLLGRSSHAVTQRMCRLELRNGRSPHHPAARRGPLTPGERVTAVRELRSGGPGRALAVARRLDVPAAVIRAAAADDPLGSREARGAGGVAASAG